MADLKMNMHSGREVVKRYVVGLDENGKSALLMDGVPNRHGGRDRPGQPTWKNQLPLLWFPDAGWMFSRNALGNPIYAITALVLQGGGALGSFQAGVYQGLVERCIHPNWVAGISIGTQH